MDTLTNAGVLITGAGRGIGKRLALGFATAGNRVPRLGILLGSVVGFLAATASIVSPNGVFLFLINTSGAIILMIYMVVAIGEIRLRHRLESAGEHLSLKMWLFPWLSWAVVAGIAAVLVLMAITPNLREQLLWSAVSVVVIAVAYAVRSRMAPVSRQ